MRGTVVLWLTMLLFGNGCLSSDEQAGQDWRAAMYGPERAAAEAGTSSSGTPDPTRENSPANPPIITPQFDFTTVDGLKMVWLEPGQFQMGRVPPRRNPGPVLNATWPVRQVTIRQGFWISATEVTQLQYEQLMGAQPSKFKGDDLPVERVSWRRAREFCRLLTERAAEVRGLAGPKEFGFVFDLPSEAQWEYACRAGTTGFFYGPTLPELAWFGPNSNERSHPVGTKQPNPWGLYDMLGNVEEWCLDAFFHDYRDAPLDERPRQGASVRRVIRGGSWHSWRAKECACATRRGGGPGYIYHDVGFRPVLTAR